MSSKLGSFMKLQHRLLHVSNEIFLGLYTSRQVYVKEIDGVYNVHATI